MTDHDAQIYELKQRIVSLQAFNRSVSHDLRSPLACIMGLAQLANDALEVNDLSLAQRMVPLISVQADACVKLVLALFDLASVDHAEIERAEVDLGALTREVVQQITLQEKQRPMPQVCVRPMPTARADASLLRAVMQNLVGNAVKFTRGSDEGCVDIGAHDEGTHVTVFVRDNGVGFDSQVGERLFDPFVRLHATTQYEGHGVGLSIVRAAVERHGGKVWATSVPGNGACFRFTLPKEA